MNQNQEQKKAIVTGNFDGCHLGHSALFEQLKKEAKARNLEPMVVSYTPHTRQLLSADSSLKLLTSDGEKELLLKRQYNLPLHLLLFDRAMSQLSADRFLREIVRDQLQASYWLMGENHRFGQEGEGRFNLFLNRAAEWGVELGRANLVEAGSRTISSTRIRSLIAEGRMVEANELLGYSYPLSGLVEKGVQRGRTIGFPTANISWDHPLKQLPPDGVYAGWVEWENHRVAAVANLGGNPTFGLERRRLEAHLIDWSGDLYGVQIRFAIKARLRATKRFSSVDELRAVLENDRKIAREMVENKS